MRRLTWRGERAKGGGTAMTAGGALLWRGRRVPMRLGLLAALLLALSGCLLDRQPQPAPPPTATPTPRPTATATPASLRVDRPPTAVVLPSARPIATATRATPSALQAAGRILYLGKLDGRQGIIAADANGANRRLVVEGSYEAPVWSPDGGRFAAYGSTTPGNLPDQLAVFDPDGRALARFPLSGVRVGQPAWSPDSRTILCLLFPPSADPRIDPPQALLLDDNGPREIALRQPRAVPWRWTPGGRVAFRIPAASQQGNQLLTSAIWTVDPADGTPRREAAGTFVPAGWSPDGGTFYAIGVPPTFDRAGVPVDLFTPSSLLAFDTITGDLHVVTSASTLAAEISATPPSAAAGRWLVTAAVAPTTGNLAVWLRSTRPPGTPITPDGGETTVVITDSAGVPLVSERLSGTQSSPPFWSPGGRQLAYLVVASSGIGLHSIVPGAGPPVIYTISQSWPSTGLPLAWSPDSRWIAFPGPAGLEVHDTTSVAPPLLLAADGLAPAWQPEVRP